MKGLSLRSLKLSEWTILGIALIGIVLAITTLFVVRDVMTGFQHELVAKIGASNASVAAALETEQNIMFLIVLLIFLIMALSILSAGVVLWRGRLSHSSS